MGTASFRLSSRRWTWLCVRLRVRLRPTCHARPGRQSITAVAKFDASGFDAWWRRCFRRVSRAFEGAPSRAPALPPATTDYWARVASPEAEQTVLANRFARSDRRTRQAPEKGRVRRQVKQSFASSLATRPAESARGWLPRSADRQTPWKQHTAWARTWRRNPQATFPTQSLQGRRAPARPLPARDSIVGGTLQRRRPPTAPKPGTQSERGSTTFALGEGPTREREGC